MRRKGAAMKRMISIAIVLVASVVLWSDSAHAQTCSNASLKGKYGFTEIGAPWNVVGVLTFDGGGNVNYDYTIVYADGNVGSDREVWTYQVSADCRFTMTNTENQ